MGNPSTSDMSAPHVGITNVVALNAGDAAILEAIRYAISERVPKVIFTVFDADASASSKAFPGEEFCPQFTMATGKNRLVRAVSRGAAVMLTSFLVLTARVSPRALRLFVNLLPSYGRLKSLKRLAQLDLLVSTGGTYLVDHYDFSPRVWELRLAHAFNIPIVLWTQSLGPFASKSARRRISRLPKGIQGVAFRDSQSQESWSRIVALPERHAVVPDSVFALTDLSKDRRDSSSIRRPQGAVSVRRWDQPINGAEVSMSTYASSVSDGISRLLSDVDFIALSTCQGVPAYVTDDSETAGTIFRDLPEVVIERSHHTPLELLQRLEHIDIALATRMHFAILCLMSRVPVCAIAYEFKTMELFKSIGLGNAVVPMNEVSADWVAEKGQQMLAEPESFILRHDELARLRQLACLPAIWVEELLSAYM